MKIVSKEELIELIEALYRLAALERGGVDNWEWYDVAMSSLDDEDEE